MSDGMTDQGGTGWGRKIQRYLDEFDSIVDKILSDEPQLRQQLINRLLPKPDTSNDIQTLELER